jgi:hypothetical protein
MELQETLPLGTENARARRQPIQGKWSAGAGRARLLRKDHGRHGSRRRACCDRVTEQAKATPRIISPSICARIGHETYQRIVRELVTDLSNVTNPQLLELARQALRPRCFVGDASIGSLKSHPASLRSGLPSPERRADSLADSMWSVSGRASC